MTTRPLRAASLGDQLAGLLRAQIVAGALAPGSHLVEDTLAADNDVSRGPVRDALKTLLGEGLLESRRRGFYVRGFSREDVEELYQVRGAMENLAARLAVENADGADWDPSQRHLDAMFVAADRQDWHEFARHDLDFHSELYSVSGNGRLAALWQQYQPIFAALLDVTNAQDPDLHPSAQDHADLLELARSGQVDTLLTHLAEHLEGSRERMCTAMAQRWGETGVDRVRSEAGAPERSA